MFSIKTAFTRAASGHSRVSLFVLALMVLAIDDDRQREERRKKREREAKAQRKPAAGPSPC